MDLFIIVLVCILGFSFPRFFFRNDKVGADALSLLWIYHIGIGLYFYWFTLNNSADALNYWNTAKRIEYDEFISFIFSGSGTLFMYVINYFPSNYLNLSYLSGTFIYMLIGHVGLLFFIKTAYHVVPYNFKLLGIQLFPLIFFLPNLHFWSVGIGKDTLLFLNIGMFAYALLAPMKRFPMLIFSLGLSFMIRPHITLFLLMAFGSVYLIEKRISSGLRIVLSILLLVLAIIILPSVLEFIRVESLSIESLTERSEIQAGHLSKSAGSAVDVQGYPFPLKVFTFLYRPLFFDATSVGAILSSFDNIILLIISILTITFKPIEVFKKAPHVVKGFLLFGIIGTLAFSPTLGNLGIMIRQKNMFTPGILVYFLWSFSYRRKELYMAALAHYRVMLYNRRYFLRSGKVL